MLNQSFSVNNFRRILDLENRKGNYLEVKFFPIIETYTDNIRKCNKQIKKRRNRIAKEELKKLYEKRRELKKEKEEILNSELQKICKKVSESGFKIGLTKRGIQGQKPLYLIEDSPEHYLTIKQLQRNISRLFGVKQANRYEIICQVKMLLSDKFPKYILRTDIKDFYEKIPHTQLFKKIEGDNLLSPLSRKLLTQLLNEYKQLTGSEEGVPRGVGISAYLAELYMRDIDQGIMAINGISYYLKLTDFKPRGVFPGGG